MLIFPVVLSFHYAFVIPIKVPVGDQTQTVAWLRFSILFCFVSMNYDVTLHPGLQS